MSDKARVHLKSDGAVLLGDHISCDGFAWGRPVRIQTHIHTDHMADFDTSKANQSIIMSMQTRDLLVSMFNADLPFRTNICGLEYESKFEVNGDIVELLCSRHMLGSAQVLVTCKDGYRVGYSSDFFWPLDRVIEVDELMVDSTYGDPLGVRRYTQQNVDDCVISNVSKHLQAGRMTAIIGYNGRLQHSLYLLSDIAKCPILCSPKSFPLVDVYHRNGFPIMRDVLRSDSPAAIDLLRKREPCLAFVTMHERRHLPWVDRCAKVSLSAHMSYAKTPLTLYDNGDCCIAFTDHADFEGTLEYVKATGAKKVWTDPRSGNAEALAKAISDRLGVKSSMAPEITSLAWG